MLKIGKTLYQLSNHKKYLDNPKTLKNHSICPNDENNGTY